MTQDKATTATPPNPEDTTGVLKDAIGAKEELRKQHDSRLRIYKDGKIVKDQTICGLCRLVHLPPMTHELHQILVDEYKEAQTCNDCIYGPYSPHNGVADAILSLIDKYCETREVEAPNTYYTMSKVRANSTIGWFSHSGIVFQTVKIGEKIKVIGRLGHKKGNIENG